MCCIGTHPSLCVGSEWEFYYFKDIVWTGISFKNKVRCPLPPRGQCEPSKAWEPLELTPLEKEQFHEIGLVLIIEKHCLLTIVDFFSQKLRKKMSEEKIEKKIKLLSIPQPLPINTGCILGHSEHSVTSELHTCNTILVIIKWPNKDR